MHLSYSDNIDVAAVHRNGDDTLASAKKTVLKGVSTLVLLYHSESAARVGINDKTKQRLRAKQMWVNWGHYVGFNGQPFRK